MKRFFSILILATVAAVASIQTTVATTGNAGVRVAAAQN